MSPTAPSVLLAALLLPGALLATEFHVALSGRDTNPGTQAAPLRTIQAAAELAQPGDVITVHAGTYRERINPPRGGVSDRRRIVYQAAPGEDVRIKGSEIVKGWSRVQGDVWRVDLPKALFGDFNPYADVIHGDWFDAKGRTHHTGAVYLHGAWLTEAASLDEVLQPSAPGAAALWFGRVEGERTTIWARFDDANPNEQEVEVNVRQTVFYPDRPGRNYLTVRGFTLSQAATPWAPPTAGQIGLIGTHWSKGWIIENNRISHSVCAGVSLGKYGDEWDNQSGNSAEGYVETVRRALKNGWNRETVGGHLVRANAISHCEQAGVVGSLGGAFSTISGNVIHDIHVRRLFGGAEMAGIKLHGAVDAIVRDNHIHHTVLAIWLDWMAQGTHVTGNLCHDNAAQDLFMEVNHGPFLVDNNLFLSPVSLRDASEGGAYAHNLFAGQIRRGGSRRATPFLAAHGTAILGLRDIQGGDNRFLNNLFTGGPATPAPPEKAGADGRHERSGRGLAVYDEDLTLIASGNIHCGNALPSTRETGRPLRLPDAAPLEVVRRDGRLMLDLSWFTQLRQAETVRVTGKILGRTRIGQIPFENPDGSAVNVNTDYFGKKRDRKHPAAGPFERPEIGWLPLDKWPAEDMFSL
jgi:alpha-L-arabinofuranosidase